jgi:hypothetical protein
MVIWKFPLKPSRNDLPYPVAIKQLPEGTQVLSIQKQDGQMCLWGLCDQDSPEEERRFAMIGTGWEIAVMEHWRHISTVQSGAFVWHWFEITT